MYIHTGKELSDDAGSCSLRDPITRAGAAGPGSRSRRGGEHLPGVFACKQSQCECLCVRVSLFVAVCVGLSVCLTVFVPVVWASSRPCRCIRASSRTRRAPRRAVGAQS